MNVRFLRRRLQSFARRYVGPRSSAVAVILVLIALGVTIRSSSDDVRAADGDNAPSATADLSRSCTSKNTLFENVWNIQDLTTIFREKTSGIVEERLDLFRTPSKWVCPTSLQKAPSPSLPVLQALADELPGWSYEYRLPLLIGFTTVRVRKPVTFENFSSILSEFRREYECRLNELEEDVDKALVRNLDIDPFADGFCCNANQACVAAAPGVSCTGPMTDDPQCNEACPVVLESPDILERRGPFLRRLEEERARARVAITNTMLTMRSFEMQYPHARELMCYSRASLDLRSVLNLLSSAASCIPKVWDALTSIHDRTP